MPRIIFKPIKVGKERNWNPFNPKKEIIRFRTSNPGEPKPIKRWPAVYDNKSHEEIIAKYLNEKSI
jgi:hypothetical protein